MGLLTTVKEGLNSLLGGAKVTLDQTSSGLKSSVEGFIGDIVIRSTFNSAKSSLLNMLSEDTPSPARLAQKSEPKKSESTVEALPAVTSSNDLMARLMGNFSEPLTQAAKKMAVQFDEALNNAGDEITKGLKRTIKSKVESIQADDVVSGLSHFLNGSLQKLSGEEGVKKEGENSTFNLNGTIQMFGWVLMSVGTLLLAGGLNQGILKPESAQSEPIQSEPVQEEVSRFTC